MTALPQAVEILKPGGVMAVISFHSGEDRTVKQFMRERSSEWLDTPGHPNTLPNPRHYLRDVKRYLPGEEEIEKNPRARSARLRVAIRNEEVIGIMSRNRMRNSQSLHWMGVLKWILIASLLAGLGLCYMLCKNQNLHLAEETHLLQEKLSAINQRNEDLTADLNRMKSLTLLDRRLKMMHSTLVAWGDPSASWMRLDLNTRARLVREGTPVKSPINLNSLNSGSAPVASAMLPPAVPARN